MKTKKFFLIILSLLSIIQSARGFIFEESEMEMNESFFKLYERWRGHFIVERSLDEMDDRFEVFKANVGYVHSSMAKPYNLKLNKFADWTFEEFSNVYGRCISGIDGLRTYEPEEVMYENETPLEVSVDWREKGAVTPVKNQTNCKSCWAFSTVATVEGIVKINGGELVSLSEQELVDCVGIEDGCDCGLVSKALDYIKNRTGITTEKNYPYTATKNDCTAPKKMNVVMVNNYNHVPTCNETALAVAVSRQPISVQLDTQNIKYMLYSGGVFDGPCGTNVNHAMALIGYGPPEPNNGNKKYWILKNSYGVGWGDHGYLSLEKDIKDPKGRCGIARFPYYPINSKVRNPAAFKDELR